MGGAGEGGAADVLAAGGAGAQAGEECGRVLPGGLPDGLVDEGRDEVGQRLTVVGKDGSCGRQFGGEACSARLDVGVEALVRAEVGVLLRVEQDDRGVTSLGGACFEERLHLLEIGRVVVEGEAAVAAHGTEIVLVGQQADGACDFAVQDASHGLVVGVRHVSPCARSINAHSQ